MSLAFIPSLQALHCMYGNASHHVYTYLFDGYVRLSVWPSSYEEQLVYTK
jgi:hypothetical protein